MQMWMLGHRLFGRDYVRTWETRRGDDPHRHVAVLRVMVAPNLRPFVVRYDEVLPMSLDCASFEYLSYEPLTWPLAREPDWLKTWRSVKAYT